ncbi:DNA-directed RNA polymerase subunit beta [Alkalibacillus haloalkaliphilus]|nr:DNA-directed RNA polymerase subunit beta [Alkalibacillus haloalkaliphilus]
MLAIILSIVALAIGMMVGYGVVGEGEEPSAVLDRSLWQSLYDYIKGK